MEPLFHTPKGIYRDIIKDPGGHIRFDSGWKTNTIVQSCHILLTAFMCNQEGVQGIQYLAVGQGVPAWDANSPPPTTAPNLLNPYQGKILVGNMTLVYLNDSGDAVAGPTNWLQISVTLDEDFPTPDSGMAAYPLREFGLFGKLGDEYYMINYVRHPVIHKDSSSTLVRTIRLKF